ncbi:MAG: hypothetical protein R3A10_07255 [Caldilineaceae bacterium]
MRFWNHWLAARVELVDQMIADFEEVHPDITVENLGQPWERRQENMFTALASNDPPEVVMAHPLGDLTTGRRRADRAHHLHGGSG